MVGRPEAVAPRRHTAVIGHGVVPKTNLMDVASGMEAGPRGHADRRVAIGVGEAHAACSQPIKIWRADHWVAAAAKHAGIVLVRHDDKHIAWLHVASLSSQ